ncbi:MAG TPA: YCF48-related protein [Kofleriaceae bacterium]|nr:YCF48-related protein [Kofleriaceae bacterium]
MRLRTLLASSSLALCTALLACATDEPVELGTNAAMPEALLATGPAGSYQVSPVPKRSTSWSYEDSGTDLGTGWRLYDSPVGSWHTGTGPLGYGETYLTTTVSYGRDPNHKHPTTYFRTPFVKNSGRIVKMYLRVMYDDGFVFYLNGHEGGRAYMPGGTITYNTLASPHEANNAYTTFDISAQIPNVVDGTNTLAIEVHQDSATSSDLVMDAELVIWMEGSLDLVDQGRIQKGEMWTFWDSPAAPPANWKLPGADVANWQQGPGPIGYGETYLSTELAPGQLTTYYRHDFTVDGAVHALTADVMYDDGFVAYINGTEVGRASMPSGTITASTRGWDHEAYDTYHTFDWSYAIPLLHPGINTIAVEVHNTATTSSDSVFDLALTPKGGWTRVDSGVTSTLEDVTSSGPVWVVGDGGVLLVSTDEGQTWSRHDPQPGDTTDLNAIIFTHPAHGVIAGDAGTILTSDDSGGTWTRQTIGTTNDVYDLAHDGETVWAVDGSNVVQRSDDGGVTWLPQPTGVDGGSFTSVTFADQTHGWIAGDIPADGGDRHSVIYGTTDGGVTWTQEYQATHHGNYLFDLDRTEPTRAWAVGEVSLSGQGDYRLRTTDGSTWTELPPGDADFGSIGVDFLDGSRGWTCGVAGQIEHTTDGGDTWTTQNPPMYGQLPWLYRIHFRDAVHGWAVGEQGAIYMTATGGE